MTTLTTERLILRPWLESDLAAFVALGQDEAVMRYFPQLLSAAQSLEFAQKIRQRFADNGWGFWPVQCQRSQQFIGFVGLNRPQIQLPFMETCPEKAETPCIEIGWRLASQYWGQGLAPEAANAALDFAFTQLQLDEVVSFTATSNLPSQRVMQKIGMSQRQANFLHPSVPAEHPLCEHVLYNITRNEWLAKHAVD